MKMEDVIRGYPYNNQNGCPHCKNKLGFVCGVCTNCGFNCISHSFEWVKLWKDDLIDSIEEIHFWRTRRMFEVLEN